MALICPIFGCNCFFLCRKRNKYKYVERQRIIPALPAPSVKKEVAETPSKSASTSKSTSSSKSKSESASQVGLGTFSLYIVEI